MLKRTNSFQIEDKKNNAEAMSNKKTQYITTQNKNRNSHDDILDSEQIKDQVKGMGNDIQVMGNRPLQYTKIKNTKMPESIKSSIMKLASGKKPTQSLTRSKITKAIFQNIKGQMFTCNICACEYQLKQKKKIGQCSHEFCDSCLRLYVDYKISKFEEVLCPAQECPQTMDTSGQFFKTLKSDLRQKYEKIHRWSLAAKNNSRLCPDQKCKQGVLLIEEGVPVKCNKCQKVYCKQCFFPIHEGLCDKNQVKFFENNLHFRQCTNCKAIVERTQGCNHMTCRCNYHFCYLCGGRWTGYDHKCGSNPIIIQNIGGGCCQCLRGQQCCTTLCRLVVKSIIFLPLFIIVFVALLSVMMVFIAFFLFLTIFMGIFPYTMEFICERDGILIIIALILYPLSMCIGIVIAFQDFFCQITGEFIGGIGQKIREAYEGLLGW